VLWNNKKLRTLLFISETEDMYFAGRTYPFACDDVLNAIANLMKTEGIFFDAARHMQGKEVWKKGQIQACTFDEEDTAILIKDNYYGNSEEDLQRQVRASLKCGLNRIIYDKGDFVPVRNLIIENAETWLHYNDLIWSGTYFPYHLIGNYASIVNQKFYIGDSVPCCLCKDNYLDTGEYMFCSPCGHKHKYTDPWCYCELCDGGIYSEDDAIYIESEDSYICTACAEEYTSVCKKCGERHYNRKMMYHNNFGILCPLCWDALNLEEEIQSKDNN
jgi:hypothetical protein